MSKLSFLRKTIIFLLLSKIYDFNNVRCGQEFDSPETRAEFVSQFLKIQATTTNTIVMCFCNNRDYAVSFSKIILKEFYSLAFIKSTKHLENFKNKNGKIFLLDISKCEHSAMEFLLLGYSNDMFREPNNWIIFNDNLSSDLSNDLQLEINAKIFEVRVEQGVFNVKALFKYSQNDTLLSSNDITKWTAEHGFIYFNKLYLPATRINLLGAPLKVSYFLNHPESKAHLTDYSEIGKDNAGKLFYTFLSNLAYYLNATHDASFESKFGLSTFNKNRNTYEKNSMLWNVQNGIADVVGIYLWVELDRLSSFHFIPLGITEPTEYVFRAPTIPVVKNLFLLPFDNIAWYCILLCLFLGTILLYIILVQEKRIRTIRKDISIVDIMMSLLSALLQKTWILEFQTFSGKFALVIIYLTFMIIFTAYSASIIVFLQGTSENVKSFKDLYDMNIEIGVHNVPYNVYYYMVPNIRTNEYWRKKVYDEKIVNKTFFISDEEGIQKMHDEYFAFQCQVSTASYLIDKTFLPHEKCNIRFAPAIFTVSDLYLAVRKKCSFTSHYQVGTPMMISKRWLISFNNFYDLNPPIYPKVKMSRIREHGLLKRSRRRLFTKKPRCEGRTDNFSGIGLKELRFIFMFCCVAFVTCLLFLLVEIAISKIEKNTEFCN